MLRCAAQGRGVVFVPGSDVGLFFAISETLIQASHAPLRSALSSVSPPHYSSSIFKRGEYALLQLVCLEANLSCSLQWTAPPPTPAIVFLLHFLRQSLERKDTRGLGEARGEFRIDVRTVFDRGGNQQAEIVKDTGGKEEGGKREPEGREVERSN